jgi:hypothetical protein
MEIELPDGTVLEAPDDADPSAVAKNYLAKQQRPDPFPGDPLLSDQAMERWSAGIPLRPSPAPTPVRDYLGRLGAANDKAQRARSAFAPFGVDIGTLEAGASLATGAVAPFIASARGLIGGYEPTNQEIEDATYSPRSESGKAQLGVLGALASPLADSGADVALLPLAGMRPEIARRAPPPKFKPRPTPTGEQIEAAAQKAYTQARSTGAVASADDFAKAKAKWLQTLDKEGFDPDLHPKIKVIAQRLEGTEGPQAFDDLEKVRRLTLRNALSSAEAEERRLARILIDDMDDFQEMSLGKAGEAGAQARELWTAKRKGEEIEELFLRAQRSAGSSNQNVENAIRVEFRNLANNQKAMRRYTPEERELIEQAAKGGPLRNTMRYFGKFAPTGPVPAALAAIAGGGGLGSAAVAGGGAASRAIAGGLAGRDVQRIINTIRRGAPVDVPNLAQQQAVMTGEVMPRTPLALPAPNIIAGARSAPGTAFAREQMGLTPDVERAGMLHPGMAHETTTSGAPGLPQRAPMPNYAPALPYRPAPGLLSDQRPMVVDTTGRVAKNTEKLDAYLEENGLLGMRNVRQPRADPVIPESVIRAEVDRVIAETERAYRTTLTAQQRAGIEAWVRANMTQKASAPPRK